MKVTFIQPAIGKKAGQKYIGTWKMEPLTYATLAGLTPPDVELALMDDRIELIDYEADTDVVAISIETYTALRAYDIADRFRARGVTVLMGGYHATLAPNEARQHADAVLTGNGEKTWPRALADVKAGRLQKLYNGQPGYVAVQPNRSIFEGKRYLPITLAEVGRGCGHHCEFCAISSYYGRAYYPRPVVDIVQDLSGSRHRFHFIVDDNVVARKAHARAWMRAVAPLGIRWAGQGTLTMARDPELLKLMFDSGCRLILIGLESLNDSNLDQMGKSWERALGERDELIQRVHDAGLGIYATFVFGFDGDDERSFDSTVAFAAKHKFYTAAFNHLLPYPGTKTYERLRAQGRLLREHWWLDRSYTYGDVAFRPAVMSPERLSELCRQARHEFSRLGLVGRRGWAALRRAGPRLWWLYWAMNLSLGEELDRKMMVPLAGNLDELPK
ncbi:MAG: radical SAM protein [Bifidobacteriaceae bacterium]|nr:radical SAM protein [Bifidobacteriaceae bacterium]